MRYILKIRLMLVLLCGLGSSLPAQQDWSWAFGDSVLMRFPGGGAPVVDPNFRTRYSLESSSCISDQNGNLKYFAMQDWVYRPNGSVIPGGFQLTVSDLTNGYMMLPVWGDSTASLFFSLAYGCGLPTLCPWVEEIRGPSGIETISNIRNLGLYHPTHSLVEKIAAVRDAGGTGWWVLMHGGEDNSFIRFKVDGNQVSPLSIQAIGSAYTNQPLNPYYPIGEICFSPLGDKLLAVTMTGIIDVFEFDRCSGQLSNWIPLGAPAPVDTGANTYYGCSFSPDGTKIYVSEGGNGITGGDRLFQFDLSAIDIPASKTLLFTEVDSVAIGQHQLGPDGKIYITQVHWRSWDDSNINHRHLSVINDPNQPGLACNYVHQQLYLQGRYCTANLPNLPNFNLPPLVAQNAEAGPPQILICSGDSIQIGYPDTTNGAVSFAWIGPNLGDTTQALQWVHPTASTWYYLMVVDSAVGIPCGITYDSIHVVVADSSLFPNASAGADTTICSGDSVLIGSIGNPGWTYLWSPTGQASSQIMVGQANVYTLTVQNPIGQGSCFEATDFVTVDTFPLLPIPPNVAGQDQTLCFGDSVWLGSGQGPGLGYQWSSGIPPDSALTLVTAPGAYALSIFNPENLGGCFLGTDTVLVMPFDSLLLLSGFAGADTTICLGDTLVLGTPLPSNWIGIWRPIAGILNPDSLVTIAMPSVTTSYILEVTDTMNQGACATVWDTVYVKVEVPFVHPAPASLEFCPGEVLIVGVQEIEGYSYSWSPRLGLNNPFVSITTVAPLATIAYTLTVTSDTMFSENCKTQDFPMTLSTEGCIVQNVVTPNGDGINDFLVLGTFNGPISLSVFDRWGVAVFSQDGYSNDWPRQGSNLPESVYWYTVKVSGEGGKTFVGEVMVLR